jgi:hypothetical protein
MQHISKTKIYVKVPNEELEASLVQWLQQMRFEDMFINGPMLWVEATKIAMKLKTVYCFQWRAKLV